MKFMMEVELGNDAMTTINDVAATLRITSKKLRDYEKPLAGETGRIMDRNGNSVGRWCFTEEEMKLTKEHR